jgi:hypothetical protein
MRLRLFPVGPNGVGVPAILDQFPAQVPGHGTRRLFDDCSEKDGYLIEEVDDTFFLVDADGIESAQVNGQPTRLSALMPGDRVCISNHEFIVSYERLSQTPPRSVLFQKYRQYLDPEVAPERRTVP